MKRTQVSTNAGLITIIGGFLAIYNDIKVLEFMTVFKGLTFGQIFTMAAPFIGGLLGIIHNEKPKKKIQK